MISKLRGTWHGEYVDVSGVGYDVEMLHQHETGSDVEIYVRSIWRETSGMVLYGFASAAERACFDAMCKVARVGPSAAMSVLRNNGVGRVVAAISAKDPTILAKSTGVGKKTMELICGYTNITPELLEEAKDTAYEQDDVVEALIALGYEERESRAAVAKARAGSKDDQEVLRESLQIVRGAV